MRTRLLWAMGIGTFGACARTQETAPVTSPAGPTPSSTASSTSVVLASASDASVVEGSLDDGLATSTADASFESPTSPDANVIADAKPDAVKPTAKPKPKGPPPLPKDAWYVQYPVSVAGKPYCKQWSASCVSLAWAISVNPDAKPTVCPASIPVACRMKGGMGDDPLFSAWGCSEGLQLPVTNAQRAAGKKDACCYASEPDCTPPWVGRVLSSDNGPARAATAQRGDWIEELPLAFDDVEPLERARLARHYHAMALGEHAAVASFAATSLVLLAHGAPPDLVAATHAAAIDEIAHAKLAFAIARAFGAGSLGPGVFTLPAVAVPTLAEFAVSTLRDACIPETIGALVVREAALQVHDPRLRAALSKVAEDEARHAELAFRTLAWAVRSGGEAVCQAVAEALAGTELPSQTEGPGGEAFGVPGGDRQHAIAVTTFREVVEPCVRALLAR